MILGSLALAVALIYSSYHFYLFLWYSQRGEQYWSVLPMTPGYASTIWARLRELADGYLRIADVSLFEYRNGLTTLHPLLNPFLYYPLYLIGGLRGVMPLADAFFAAITFALLYKIAHLLTGRFFLAAPFASIFVMVRDLPFMLLPRSMNAVKDLVKVFLPVSFPGDSRNRLNFLTMESVKPGFVIFGPFLIFVFLLLKSERRKYAVLAGVFYGLLFYTYTYYWIYGTIVLGIIFLSSLLRRKYRTARYSTISLAIGGGISLYYWMTYFAAQRLPWIETYLNRTGWIESGGHQFRTSQWFFYIVVVVLLVILYRYCKARARMFIFDFLAVLLIAGVVGLNIQVFTGTNVQPVHWYLRIIFIPLALSFLMCAQCVFERVEKKGLGRPLTVIVWILALSVLGGSASDAYAFAKIRFHTFEQPTGVMPSVLWMNEHLPRDAVVLTPIPYSSELFLYYTPAKIFLPKAAGTMAGEDEMIERLFILYSLYGIPASTLDAELRNDTLAQTFIQRQFPATHMALFDYLYFQQFYSQALDASINIVPGADAPPGLKVDQIVSSYGAYPFDISDLGKKYKVDYLYLGPLEKEISTADFDEMPDLEKVYDVDGVRLYKIQKTEAVPPRT